MLLTRQAAADFLGVSVRTIDRERARGNLTWASVGGGVRFNRGNLELYLLKRKNLSESLAPSPCHGRTDFDSNADTSEARRHASTCDLGARPPSPVFEFARFLRGHAVRDRLQDFESVVKSFSLERGMDAYETWVEFNQVWPYIKYPNYGRDGLAVCVDRAIGCPISLPIEVPHPAEPYVSIASIAFYLFEYNNGHPFLLPGPRLSAILGINNPSTVSKIVRWLRANGIIRCVDENYRFGVGKRECKKYSLGALLLRTTKLCPLGFDESLKGIAPATKSEPHTGSNQRKATKTQVRLARETKGKTTRLTDGRIAPRGCRIPPASQAEIEFSCDIEF